MGQAKQRGTFEERKAAAITRNATIFKNRIERREGEDDKTLDKRWADMVRKEPAATYGVVLKMINKYAGEIKAEAAKKALEEKVAKQVEAKEALKDVKPATTPTFS